MTTLIHHLVSTRSKPSAPRASDALEDCAQTDRDRRYQEMKCKVDAVERELKQVKAKLQQ